MDLELGRGLSLLTMGGNSVVLILLSCTLHAFSDSRDSKSGAKTGAKDSCQETWTADYRISSCHESSGVRETKLHFSLICYNFVFNIEVHSLPAWPFPEI